MCVCRPAAGYSCIRPACAVFDKAYGLKKCASMALGRALSDVSRFYSSPVSLTLTVLRVGYGFDVIILTVTDGNVAAREPGVGRQFCRGRRQGGQPAKLGELLPPVKPSPHTRSTGLGSIFVADSIFDSSAPTVNTLKVSIFDRSAVPSRFLARHACAAPPRPASACVTPVSAQPAVPPASRLEAHVFARDEIAPNTQRSGRTTTPRRHATTRR